MKAIVTITRKNKPVTFYGDLLADLSSKLIIVTTGKEIKTFYKDKIVKYELHNG